MSDMPKLPPLPAMSSLRLIKWAYAYGRACYEAGVAAEREACAALCDKHAARGWPRAHAVDCADAIRARGEKQ